MADDFETLAAPVAEVVEALRMDDEIGLPVKVVRQQRALIGKTDAELREIVVAAAVALAARSDPSITPGHVLTKCMESVQDWRGDRWEEIKAKVRRIWVRERTL